MSWQDLVGTALAVASVTAPLLLLYVLVTKGRKGHGPLPPGPGVWEALSGLHRARTSGRLAEVVRTWAQRYGEMVLVRVPVLGVHYLFLNSANVTRRLFTDKGTRDVSSHRDKSMKRLLNPKSILSVPPDLPQWTAMRKLLHTSIKFFGEGSQRIERIVRSELCRLVDSVTSQQGGDVDPRPLLSLSVFNIIAILLTGTLVEEGSPICLAMLEHNNAARKKLEASVMFTMRLFPFLRHVPGTRTKALWDDCERKRKRLHQVLVDDMKSSMTVGKPRGLVDVFVEEQLRGQDWLTDDYLKALVEDVLSGGTLTTSETLSSIFLFLTHHSDVTRKIQAEVDSAVGVDEKPGLEHRALCPYSEAVIMESLRLLCMTPLGAPHSMKTGAPFQGYFIPQGTMLFTSQWVFHRAEELWEDPTDFRPERFLNDDGKLLPMEHPLRQQMLPFGIGKRACPGESFARARLFLFVTTLLQRFDLLPPEKEQLLPLTDDCWILGTFRLVKPYRCRFVPRTRDEGSSRLFPPLA